MPSYAANVETVSIDGIAQQHAMLDECLPARDDDAVRLEPGVCVKTVRGIEAHTDCERRAAAIAPQQAGGGDRLRETAGGRQYAQCAAHRLFTLGRRHRGGHDRSRSPSE